MESATIGRRIRPFADGLSVGANVIKDYSRQCEGVEADVRCDTAELTEQWHRSLGWNAARVEFRSLSWCDGSRRFGMTPSAPEIRESWDLCR